MKTKSEEIKEVFGNKFFATVLVQKGDLIQSHTAYDIEVLDVGDNFLFLKSPAAETGISLLATDAILSIQAKIKKRKEKT